MTSAFRQWPLDGRKPQIQLGDHPTENQAFLPGEILCQDIKQTNITSSAVQLQTLDGILHWLSNR